LSFKNVLKNKDLGRMLLASKVLYQGYFVCCPHKGPSVDSRQSHFRVP
jgi:hypothetical protein